MKYHAPTNAFTFAPEQLQRAASELLWSIRCIRKASGLPLEPRDTDAEGCMKDPDFAEQAVLDAAAALGIDLGASRYGKLDVRDE
jgi:hypothetical protein